MRVIQTIPTSTLCLLFITVVATAAAAGDNGRSPSHATPLEKKTENRARYVIKIAGCNDCHTTGIQKQPARFLRKTGSREM